MSAVAERDAVEADENLSDDEREVRRWRYQEARDAGLTIAEASLYADASDIDCSQLRRLVKCGATPQQIASALL